MSYVAYSVGFLFASLSLSWEAKDRLSRDLEAGQAMLLLPELCEQLSPTSLPVWLPPSDLTVYKDPGPAGTWRAVGFHSQIVERVLAAQKGNYWDLESNKIIACASR